MRLTAPPAGHALDELCVNTLRFLVVDMVQQANSGDPGLPLGPAAMAHAFWDRSLRFNPRDPMWPNRDRFVLSAGHGCALLYALLHVSGFDLPLEEVRRFRQWGSPMPGHPEYGRTAGVEATTGPLGRGLTNALGMAIAEAALAARFNRPGHEAVDHHTYFLASDGDLEEGISSDAGSDAEQLLGLRSIPGMTVIRPADANETVAAWRIAIEQRRGPTTPVLSRQGLPVLDLGRYSHLPAGVAHGGYVPSAAPSDAPLDVIAVDTFGASAPGPAVMQHYGFTVDNVCNRARDVVSQSTVKA
jgi:transketolase